MSISFQCPDCKKHLSPKDELVGKRVKCPSCGNVILVPAANESRPDDHTVARQKDLALAKLVDSIRMSCEAAYEKQTSAGKMTLNLVSVLGGFVAGLTTLAIGIGMFSLSLEMIRPRPEATKLPFIGIPLAILAFCCMFVAPFFVGFRIARLLTATYCPAPMEVRKRLEVLVAKFPEYFAAVGGLDLYLVSNDGKWKVCLKPMYESPSAGPLDESKRRDALFSDPSAFYQQRLIQQEAERERERIAAEEERERKRIAEIRAAADPHESYY